MGAISDLDSAQDRVDLFDFLPPAQIIQGHKVDGELWLWDILEIKEVVDDFNVLSCLTCNREKNSGFIRRSSIQLTTEICLCDSFGFLEIQAIVSSEFFIRYYC